MVDYDDLEDETCINIWTKSANILDTMAAIVLAAIIVI